MGYIVIRRSKTYYNIWFLLKLAIFLFAFPTAFFKMNFMREGLGICHEESWMDSIEQHKLREAFIDANTLWFDFQRKSTS